MTRKISADQVKQLRYQTGVGMMDAKKALEEAEGDLNKAVEILRKSGQARAAKKAGRAAQDGLVHSYIHGEGRIGVLVEVNSETDFVAKNEDFKMLVHDIALHVAASAPQYISREEVPEEVISKEKEIYLETAKTEGKPTEVVEKIVAGKLEKFYQETCLLEQPFVRDRDKTVKDLINEKVAVLGENIQVKRFVRYVLGEG